MESPQTAVWGPSLWTILHSATERIGTQLLKRLPQEESRIWIGLLTSLQYTLPCPLCKKHYKEYSSKHKIISFSKDSIRTWLFTLHADINQRLNKDNILTIDKLTDVYSIPFDFALHYSVIYKQMKCALRMGWLSHDDINRTIRFFEEMKRFYSF